MKNLLLGNAAVINKPEHLLYALYQSKTSVRYAVRYMATIVEVKHGFSIASVRIVLSEDARTGP